MSKYKMTYQGGGFVIDEWDQVACQHRTITKPKPLAETEACIKKLKHQEDLNLTTRAQREWRGERDV